MGHSHLEASRRLFEMAEHQQGFFTAKQAKSAGFAENTHPYHVQAGNWTREHRGVYRITRFPIADRPDLVLWSLWSRNRKEETEGVFSHQTALSLYEISDINPAKLHMTVPKHFRRNSEIPEILVLHYADIPQADIEARGGFQLTRPLRTIIDLIGAGAIDRHLIRQSIEKAFERGLITRQQVRQRDMSDAVCKFFGNVGRRVA